MKNKRLKKYALLVLFIIFLYVLTLKGVIPLVLKVVESDLFFKQTEDDPVGELHNSRTYTALLHCENQLRADRGASPATHPTAAENEYMAWGLGDHTYVIKSTADLPANGAAQNVVRANIGCKIKYEGGAETDPANWSVIGVGTNDEK